MEHFVRSAEDVARTFGYHPRPVDLLPLLRTIRFPRLIAVGGRVPDIVDHVPQVRTATEVELPRGLYWFAGIDEPLVMVVNAGVTSDGVAVDVDELVGGDPITGAYDWAEHLWENGAAVPPPAFAVGDDVVTRTAGRDSQVRERQFVGGSWLYKIRLDGMNQMIAESDLDSAPEGSEPVDWVQTTPSSVERFGATLTRGKLAASLTDTVFSFRATRTVFRPYQFKPVLRLLNTGATRILVADEVGLGKTIEAGLIWTELEARHAAARVLIVAPSSLVGKWQEETAERFGFAVTELDSAGLARFLDQHRAGRLPKRFAHVTSLERLRAWDGLDELADVPPQFDLIVVDEAHAMRNPGTKSHALGEQLGDWADARVFLTATPVNLGNHDLASMLELLAPEDFADPDDLKLRLEPNAVLHRLERMLLDRGASGADRLAVLDDLKTLKFGPALMSRPDYPALRDVLARDALTPADVVEARRHLAEFNALSSVITRTRKAEIDEAKALREPQMVEVTWTAAERTFYNQYVQWCVRRADHAGQPLHFCMQMPLRLASACLPAARDAALGSAAEWAPTDEDDPNAATPSVPIAPHAELVLAAQALQDDSKFDRLLPLVRNLVAQRKRALLFTFSRPTLAYLQRRLSPYARVAVLHGGVARDERRRVMAAFRAGEFDVVLANRVASEGLDFEFCSVVVNYDLPWNPMEVEQRIGRIDRIGQLEQKILVVNFFNDQTIDEKILKRVLERIGVFEQAIGALEPIIQSELPAVLEAVCDFTLSEAQRQAKTDQFMTAIEAKRAEAERLVDATSDLLVSNDVDVSELERDLVRAGRYVGQRELAHLLHDWAETARATGVVPVGESRVLLRGNATMADQVHDVVRRGHRMQAEVTDLEHTLRDERDLALVLDQESARTGGGTLLTATHPLVLAAVAVPGHRQARFANVRAKDATAPSGRYAVVLALVAGEGDRQSRELWGAAVDLEGREASAAVPDALLAALARGDLRTAHDPPWTDELVDPVVMAADQLQERFAAEQQRRRLQANALADARRVSLTEQLNRKLAVIARRMETAQSRGRRGLHMFEGQRRRAQERHADSLRLVDQTGPGLLTLTPLAACYLEIAR